MGKKEDENKNKKHKKIIIIIIILLLLLMLIKLWFEFRAERQRLEEFKAEKSRIELEEQNRKNLIDSLCNIYPGECANFQKYGSVGNIMNYANLLSDKKKDLQFIRDSLCFAEPEDCEKCKKFSNFDDFKRCMDSLMNEKNRERLNSLIDSLCKIDPENCDKYKNFSDLDKLREFAENLKKLREREISDSINQAKIDSLCVTDTINCEKCKKFTKFDDFKKCMDSLKALREKEIADSIARANENKCKDTIAPWVYPEPTGGLYFESIKVSFFVSESNAQVFYKLSKDAEFRLWGGEYISISQNAELFYFAIDSCENKFEEQKKNYEFRAKSAQGNCPDQMALVETPQGNFCIDQFEWGNGRGVRPRNMVSQAQARDSCISIGKRLCTSDEWTTACRGPYNWKYPYGNNYIKHACVTQDTTFQRSGEAGECRGWLAVYDMTGNLAEWTSTRSEENNRFFVVKGGFWESGSSATCDMARYSYYPQNQHTNVGFRCCADLGQE